MGFLNPKSSGEDERLPGAAGLHLDVDPKRCPSCRRETAPWQDRCPDCGEIPVASSELPGQDVALPPGLQDLADDLDAELDTEDDAAGDADARPGPQPGHPAQRDD